VRAAQVTANALYGFTGAQVSMLQCAPMADSCLALGAASTRRAREILEDLAATGANILLFILDRTRHILFNSEPVPHLAAATGASAADESGGRARPN
jgi:DNA polymerase family B